MSSNGAEALRISNLTKRYGSKHGIAGINLTVRKGEVFGFLGPNGAGKSTTINAVLDILRPSEGTIRVLGLDHHKHAKQVHARIGFLSGDMETDPSLTGKQYLTYVANLRGGVKWPKIQELATRLKADLSVRIKHLSRGNKQKIGLIAALMHDPDLLIFDEPTSGLDPLMQAEFAAIVREHKERGKTAFISSHVLSEVQSMCDRVGFIREGKLVNVSTIDELLARAPRHVTANFKNNPPESSLQQLQGAENFKRDGNVVSFLFKGDVNQLIGLLNQHSLASLQITETDLEELFMSYYRNERHEGGRDV